jgi:adenylate cyclase
MANARVQRRLAAIVMADVVGFSQAMGADESGTLTILRDRHRNVILPAVSEHRGRVVKLMGDGILIEFGSAVNAVTCALEIQQRLAGTDLPLRFGINLGEVIEEGDDIYGDGVNVAARLEPLAPAGGICLSAKVYQEIFGRMEFSAEDLGDVPLKNIDRPVHVYRVRSGSGDALPQPGETATDLPSIAVLPFTNMSGDPNQEYFSDGITENIITDLAKFRDLAVIARNSSFSYKGKSPNIQQVCRDLGARYVLEGSVQRSGARIRITAQLIEGATGRHLWAERYDRRVEDIFVVQDEVTETIVGTLASSYGGRLRKAWEARTPRGTARNYQAFDCFLRGLQAFDSFTQESVSNAREHFLEAIRINPEYARAFAKLAWTHLVDVIYGWTPAPEASLQSGLDAATASIVHDDDEAWGHWALAGYHLMQHHHDIAVAEFDRAISLNPNDADVLTDAAWCLSYAGQAADGLELATKAIRLNPHHPEWYLSQLGAIYFDLRRYSDAVATLNGIRELNTLLIHLYRAASLAALGQDNLAMADVEAALNLDPSASVARCTSALEAPYKNASDLQHFRGNLQNAGFPP